MNTDDELPEVVILAGGLGTRLRAVVSDRPKPMADVAGRPFVEWLVLALKAQGVRRLIFSTGYKSEVIEAYFGNGRQWGMNVLYSREPIALGTGGAVRQALSVVSSERFLVMNGDSYCRIDVRSLLDFHLRQNARASLWLVPVEDCRRYGTVEIDQLGAVQAFREKSPEKVAGLINAGVYLLEREAVELIPQGRAVSIETELFPQLIGNGLYGLAGTGPFIDIGTPESYASAEEFLASESLV